MRGDASACGIFCHLLEILIRIPPQIEVQPNHRLLKITPKKKFSALFLRQPLLIEISMKKPNKHRDHICHRSSTSTANLVNLRAKIMQPLLMRLLAKPLLFCQKDPLSSLTMNIAIKLLIMHQNR